MLFRHAPDHDRVLPRHKQPLMLDNPDGSHNNNSDEDFMVL